MIKIKNLHLIVSAIVIITVGLTYGIFPNKVLPILFDFKVESVDLNNVFRAIMGLYLAIAIYWIIAIFDSKHWRNATLLNIIFMGGLAFGRIISMIDVGIPSLPFTVGVCLEIFFMSWGIFNLKNSNNLNLIKDSNT